MDESGSADPTTLGLYRIVAFLGERGAGRVLLGVDEAGQQAAVTVVHAEVAAQPGFRERFRREVTAAGSAPAWFTSAVLAADADAEQPWFATAYVEGPSLQTLVRERGPFSPPGVASMALRIADGLAVLHGGGLAHRNITPATVVLAGDGPHLTDMGITGSSTGSPEFFSPEQAAGERHIGAASDIFSFGSLIAFAATGRSPFAAEDKARVLHRLGYTEPDLGPLTGPVRTAVAACLQKDPLARPTAAQVGVMLRGGGEPVVPVPAPATPAPPPPNHPSRRRGLLIGAAAVAVALIAGITTAILMPGRTGGSPDPPPTQVAAPPSAPTTTALPLSDPAAGAVLIDAATDPRFGVGSAAFASPSRNIACRMDPDQVRCDVTQNSWTLPPTPPTCTLDYGTGAVLSGSGPAELSCVGDTLAAPTLTVLDYGQAVRFADVICVSRETGLRCENPTTRHGFVVSRAAYQLF
ncbi:serine/threonine-protein kinase [Pseudonocardia sp. TRM90224]|uniref:serine/threonine-protein kinase n=1 Tax=Pseudonocardia sp. TRM90224 TaxID=2812678 RepID=UPI001E5041DB|nr:serine/threonine-protein kinase [Pseudonocardia sp. TRM90224]